MAAKCSPKRNGKAVTPVVLNQAINIPLNKLVLSEDNVRKINADDTPMNGDTGVSRSMAKKCHQLTFN